MKKEKEILIVGLAVFIFGLAVLFYFILSGRILVNKFTDSSLKTNVKIAEETPMDNSDAFSLALGRASEWQADAKLAYIVSGGRTNRAGQTNDWTLIFASNNAPDRGYKVIIKNKKIFSAQEEEFVGQGAAFVSDIITPQEAISRAEEVKGAPIEVLGVEAIYNQEAKAWYWGIKTPESVITIRASK